MDNIECLNSRRLNGLTVSIFFYETDFSSNLLFYVIFFQPYLKEILKEIGIYNMRAPHKQMWELKPEYRHYTEGDKKEDTR